MDVQIKTPVHRERQRLRRGCICQHQEALLPHLAAEAGQARSLGSWQTGCGCERQKVGGVVSTSCLFFCTESAL